MKEDYKDKYFGEFTIFRCHSDLKQERKIMHLAQIMNTFQHEKDKVKFKLLEFKSTKVLEFKLL